MPKLYYGTKRQIEFENLNDFYEALGFLAKSDGTTELRWEHNENQGAWGSEGRIQCYKNLGSFPTYFSNAFTAGTGNILKRINCNEYVATIINDHHFNIGATQNIGIIRGTVPATHHADFDRGLSL